MQGCVSGRRTRLGRKPLHKKMHPADRSKSLLPEYGLVHRHLCWPYSYSLHLRGWRHCYILQLVVTLLYHEFRWRSQLIVKQFSPFFLFLANFSLDLAFNRANIIVIHHFIFLGNYQCNERCCNALRRLKTRQGHVWWITNSKSSMTNRKWKEISFNRRAWWSSG